MIKRWKIGKLMAVLWVTGLCSLGTAALAEPDHDFVNWLAAFRERALAHGIDREVFDNAFHAIEAPMARTIKADRRQPEFVESFSEYLGKRTSERRIQRGRQLLVEQQVLLQKVQDETGIPARLLVALWGIETNFGDYMGKFPIIHTLASLAYDPRRSRFFEGQLLAALQIIDAGHIEAGQMIGSWAGAMGHLQFMPQTYIRHARDGDGDNRRDLKHSLPDVFYSGAGFLRAIGWKPGEIWGREVHLPAGFDFGTTLFAPARPLYEWRQLGVTKADGGKLPTYEITARLLAPMGARGPVFLVYPNFDAIMRWNYSEHYALTVGLLADALIGQDLPIFAGDLAKIRQAQILSLQRMLHSQGYDPGGLDGVFGSKTRRALQRWQKTHGMVADGWPARQILNQSTGY